MSPSATETCSGAGARVPGIRDRQSGAALVTALFLFILLSALSLFSVRSAFVQGSRATLERSSMHALELAEIAVSEALYELGRDDDLDAVEGIGNVSGQTGEGTYSARTEHLAANRFRVLAQGESGGIEEIIEVVFENDSAPFVYAISAVDSVTVSNITTDMYDSRLGDYASQEVNNDAAGFFAQPGGDVASNGDITLTGPTIRGDALAGPGHTVSGGSGTTVTGTTGNLLEPMVIPDPEYEAFLEAWNTNDNASIPTGVGVIYNAARRSLTINGGATLTLSGGPYALNTILITGGSTLEITGPTVIYVRESILAGGGSITNATGIPSDLQIIAHPHELPGATSPVANPRIQLVGSTEQYVSIYAPAFSIDIMGGASVYGAVVARTVTAHGSPTAFHYDAALGRLRGYVEYQQFQRISWRLVSRP